MEDPCNSYLGAGDDPSGGMSAAFTGNTNRKRARFIVLCPPYMTLRPTPQLPPDTGHGRALVDANSRWTALLHEMMHLSKISSKSRVAAYLGISYIDAIISYRPVGGGGYPSRGNSAPNRLRPCILRQTIGRAPSYTPKCRQLCLVCDGFIFTS